MPKYYTIDSALDIWPAWAVTAWWLRDQRSGNRSQM